MPTKSRPQYAGEASGCHMRKDTVTVAGRNGSAKLVLNCIMMLCDGRSTQPCGQFSLSIAQSVRMGVDRSGATGYCGAPTTSICAVMPLCKPKKKSEMGFHTLPELADGTSISNITASTTAN